MSLKPYPAYKDSGVAWLGQVPEHWSVVKLKRLFDLMRRSPREEDGIVTAFRDGEVTLRSNRRVDGFTNAIHEHGYQGIRKGDLVIHAMDAFAGAIGVSDSDGKSTPVYSVCEPRQGVANAFYFGRLIRTMALAGFVNSLAKGIRERSTEFRWADAGEIELPVPPMGEQEAVTAFLDRETGKIDELIAEQEKLITLLAEKRQATISHAVTKGLNPAAPMKDSGVEWLGQIPAHWEATPVKSVASLYGRIGYRGYTTEDIVDEGEGAITLSPSNLVNGVLEYGKCTFIRWEKYFESPEIMMRDEDIVMVKTGSTFGKVSYARVSEGQFVTINPQLVLFKEIRSESKYLFYCLFSEIVQKQAELSNTGGTIPTMTQEAIGNFKIALAPLDEQRTLVTFLDFEIAKLDDLTSQANRVIDLLKERRTALISAAVTGKIDVRGAVVEQAAA